MRPFSLLKYLFVWQLAIIVTTLISPRLFPLRETFLGGGSQVYLTNPVLYSRANFDGKYYLYIAERGYGYAQHAFFPFYPRLIKFFTPLFKQPEIAAVTISLTSFFLALIFLSRLIKLDFPSVKQQLVILILLLFPTSFFFSFVYTEGLFLFLVVVSFYFARTGKWWLVSLLGAAASYTRFIGVFLFPALLIEWWQQSKKISHLLPLLIVPTGLLIYSYYLHRTTGDALAFIHAQSLFGQMRGDKIILLYQVFWRYAKMLVTVNRTDPLFYSILLEASTAAIFLVTSIYSFVKHRLSYALFNLAAYLIPTLTGSFVSLPRYVLVCFPSLLLLAGFISRLRPPTRNIIFCLMGLLSAFFLALFVRGYWVS